MSPLDGWSHRRSLHAPFVSAVDALDARHRARTVVVFEELDHETEDAQLFAFSRMDMANRFARTRPKPAGIEHFVIELVVDEPDLYSPGFLN